jgi:peptide deformylase
MWLSKMIIINNEEALRVACQPVELVEASQLIEQLDRELEHANRLGRDGIGLAGIQCGIAKQVAIVRMSNVKLNLVNASIKSGYDLTMFEGEGCLSFPGRIENTMRYQEIHVIDNLVEPHSFIATGLTAVVIQHEIAHYNSDLFFDHKVIKTEPIKRLTNKTGPNDPCPCGKINEVSGKVFKYKRCCGR